MPAGLPGLRLRQGAGVAPAHAEAGAAVRGRGRREPARRVRATPRGGQDVDVDDRRSRRRLAPAPGRGEQDAAPLPFAGGIAWIVVVGVLLAGIVAVNVVVLQLNVEFDGLSRERAQLKADNALLRAQLSSASANAGSRGGGDEARTPAAPTRDHHLRALRRERERPAANAGFACSSPPSAPSSSSRSPGPPGCRRREDRYEKMASTQHRETIEIPAGRGTIYDRTGEPLAIGELATTVYADPRNVVAPNGPRSTRGGCSGSTRDSSIRALSDRSKASSTSTQGGSREGEGAATADVPGLGFYPEERRTYPQGRVAAHVLGFAGTDNHGLDGLERSLDKTLSGRPGYEIVVRDPVRARDRRRSRRGAERQGRNVVAHDRPPDPGERGADPARTVRQLARARRYGDRDGSADRRDPRDGERPTFDANDFATASRGRASEPGGDRPYEPGLDVQDRDDRRRRSRTTSSRRTSFRLAPTIQVADRVIREAHIARHRDDDRQADPLRVVERRDDHDRPEARRAELASWIDRFGFGKRTGVDFPGESPGLVLPYEDWSGSTIGTVPIGQGIAVTPLQMVERVRGDRERRRLTAGAPHREGRRQEGASRRRAGGSSRATPRTG